MKAGVFVRARTADGRWASVNAADLDNRSFRLFVLRSMALAGLVVSVNGDWPEFNTELTKEQAEGSQED